MSLVISGVFWAAVVLFAALILVLSTPLRLELAVRFGNASGARATLRLLGGYGPPVLFSRKSGKARRKIVTKVAEPKQRTKRRVTRPLRLVQAIAILFGDILRQVSLTSARIDVRFGLGDPAETGALYGRLLPLAQTAASRRRICVSLKPDFEAAVIDGRAEVTLSLTPIRLVLPFAQFAWRAYGPK